MRDEYIDAIKASGFQEVRVIDEVSFPVEFMANDPTARAVIENLRMTPEKIKEVARLVKSVRVLGYKRRSKISNLMSSFL
jgi:hypothetical protein